MDRRALLQSGAAIAAASVTNRAFAQGAPPAPIPARKFALDACSRNLQWLRAPQDLAKGLSDLGMSSVDLSVMAYPGHVDPAKAKTDLPAFVNALKQSGITVTAVTCPITDADSANAEAILDAAAALGIKYYGWGGLRYDTAAPYAPQLDALKPRIAKLAKLNEKYGIKGLYQPQAGTANVGASFLDILEVLRGSDPRFIAVRYDTACPLPTTAEGFVTNMRLGGAYIGGIALTDAAVSLDLPVYNESFFAGGDIPTNNAGDNFGTDGGNPLAIGGGGVPLPYHVHPKRLGSGMIDLTLTAKTLKAMNFDGPVEVQIAYPLGGAESGADKITLARQWVLGQIKHDRLTAEAAFHDGGWNVDIARPAFMTGGAAGGRGGRGAAGGRGGRGGAPQ